MTSFANSTDLSSALDSANTPHQEVPPPPQQLDHSPFAHQLNAPNPPFSPSNTSNPSHSSQRPVQDFRQPSANGKMSGANGNGPVPVPSGQHGRAGNGPSHGAQMREMGFGGPRSPPNNKSTSHVPCKFYRQGQCQAGKACPFLHSDEPLTERAPCKYFTKGNCKFGPKCALAHILPNGQVVNRNNVMGSGPFGRMNIPHHPEPAPGGSLLSMQAHMQPQFPYQNDFFPQKAAYDQIPTIDTTFSSHPGSNFGSPPNESGRLPTSPTQKGLSVMDVPLPASFDSQGISHMARYGPIAASVPSKFLANSPPSSYQNDSSALRNLHNSAFGDGKPPALGSSPPDSVEQPTGRRIMHSEIGASRRGMISASVGARAPIDDWPDTEMIGKFEEDLLPNSLSDLLTPQEKMRRFSRDHGDNDGNSLSHRASLSRLGASPTASDSKIGSPSAATASPSRYQSLWGRRPPTEGSFESGSLPGASAFGHVGSPLRNSTLHPGASPSLRAVGRPTTGDVSPFVSSPPRQASMSMISQQLQRTRLSSRASDEGSLSGLGSNHIHPGINRVTSNTSVGSAGTRLGMDRAVSSSSINRERIEEEQGLFSMEEEEELERGKGKDGAAKRLSGPWGSGGKASPNITPIGGHRIGNLAGLGKDSGPWGNNA
ncbi:hypothetical protein BU24DRAFT_465697 [Aaosphaeria arxii CBS 175.79]|uniref:C3H1-type domain-containing protein n=1 Tax=Aaosphaeria arxii CBS 175.79 TaxID=1450172 RepID=A0A6A5XG34_9PLEO|nr:uncharacterized protein BU24DRAFT_465697 [Aaosphaeria arxii CBS 175.79]KAF2012128.1 hypothetical protein BU24DRAFT_465697 [Aaosphaeria arxii CBS 175.79]